MMVETSPYDDIASAPEKKFGPRGAFIFLLALVELPLLAFVFDPLAINDADPAWLTVRAGLREMVSATIFFFAALAVLLAPQRRKIGATISKAATSRRWGPWLLANIIGFIFLLASTPMLNASGQSGTPPWAYFSLWSAAAIGLYALLALSIAPVSFWAAFVKTEKVLIALAAGAAAFIQTAAAMSQQSWSVLSEATFQVSAFLLQLWEQDVVVEPARRVLGVGDFRVNIAAACSGYEGIGLVTAFLAMYMWIFRSVLRFPNVFLVLPIGVAAIWFLNSVRIAVLVSLGAHLSPEVASTGFHSQAGWMMFLIVTIGIMLITHRLSFFHDKQATYAEADASPAFNEAVLLLAPFMAMTASGIIAAAFTGEGYWLYSLRVIAISVAVLIGWRYYRNLDWNFGWAPIGLGVIVGALWIATDPGRNDPSELGAWLSALPATAAAFWIAMRVFGTILLAPIAEELAFRGYLHRKLIADKFEAVAEGAFAWKALIISSALFALLHERWLSGALAGAVFALALYRSGKITGAIAAHVTANAIIALWAIIFAQWSLF